MIKNKKLTPYAQNLRRNMTKEERHLWYDFLKELPLTVKRQSIVEKYILDFYIPDKKIAIELDGSQHYEDEALINDKERDIFLKNKGITTLRYTNDDIHRRFDAVCRDILEHI